MNSDLAIVIPAFKAKYFKKTLLSLANQTNSNFTVYVGDDCSPYNLKQICEDFSDILNIKYTRFNDNIGAKNLVNQWKRCISLTNDEKWLWLFSDDDLIDKTCVDSFLKKIKQVKGKCDICRFNTIVIDDDDKILWEASVSPNFETSEEMAYHLLKGNRGNSIADHIFSREVYNISGGFVFTEYAQGADWAMSILFSQKNGIYIIPDSKFYWRYSGENISATSGKLKSRMLRGHLQFLQWVLVHFEYLNTKSTGISYAQIVHGVRINLKITLQYHFKGVGFFNTILISWFMFRNMRLSIGAVFKDLVYIQRTTFHQRIQVIRMKKNIKILLGKYI